MASFTASVQAFKGKAERKMLAVFRESAKQLADEANTPRAQGGKMPVDTGFLRNTIAGKSGSMPIGPTQGDPNATYNAPVGEPVELAILRTQLGDKLYIGWTANYAQAMEVRYAFMRSAAQNWQQIVFKVAAEVSRR